ncbi:hypothetical protein EVAR_3545_1 [Eumeta japonica]|uniref:Uncharacterized protein n=1 Tax=Eumeta variegata TaxID=151549 RepID=A0A4C1SYV3_EUMVA|nr:hypothetical protein EVAR_3545_1 [Eumeta japonica]
MKLHTKGYYTVSEYQKPLGLKFSAIRLSFSDVSPSGLLRVSVPKRPCCQASAVRPSVTELYLFNLNSRRRCAVGGGPLRITITDAVTADGSTSSLTHGGERLDCCQNSVNRLRPGLCLLVTRYLCYEDRELMSSVKEQSAWSVGTGEYIGFVIGEANVNGGVVLAEDPSRQLSGICRSAVRGWYKAKSAPPCPCRNADVSPN